MSLFVNIYIFGWAVYDLFLTEHEYYEEDDEREDKIGVWVTLIYSGCFVPMAIMILYTHISYTNFKNDRSREKYDEIQTTAGKLREENEALKAKRQRLEEELSKLQNVESALREDAVELGANAKSLIELVRRNKEVQSEMRVVSMLRGIQGITRAIYDADQNCNFILSTYDVEMLLISLSLIEDIVFDREKVKGVIEENDNCVIIIFEAMREELRKRRADMFGLSTFRSESSSRFSDFACTTFRLTGSDEDGNDDGVLGISFKDSILNDGH